MEITFNGMVYRFQTPAEAIEWERLRSRSVNVRSNDKQLRQKPYNRTYSKWTKEEIFELMRAIYNGARQKTIWKDSPIGSQRHSKMATEVMFSRLKRVANGRQLPKDVKREVKDWVGEWIKGVN